MYSGDQQRRALDPVSQRTPQDSLPLPSGLGEHVEQDGCPRGALGSVEFPRRSRSRAGWRALCMMRGRASSPAAVPGPFGPDTLPGADRLGRVTWRTHSTSWWRDLLVLRTVLAPHLNSPVPQSERCNRRCWFYVFNSVKATRKSRGPADLFISQWHSCRVSCACANGVDEVCVSIHLKRASGNPGPPPDFSGKPLQGLFSRQEAGSQDRGPGSGERNARPRDGEKRGHK